MSLKLIMPDKEFYEINKIERAVQIGRIYFNILLPDPETGLTRYERNHENISADLRTFIDANKEKNGSRRIYDFLITLSLIIYHVPSAITPSFPSAS